VKGFLKKKVPVPLLENVLKLSLGGNAYHWVCSKLMKAVVGSSIWNRRYYKEILSEFATVSDESFVVLTIENNYERWVDEAKHRVKRIEEDYDEEDETWREGLAPAKFTNSGESSSNGRGTNRRCGGWSTAGYLRFNELHGLVKEDRKRRANFELKLKEQFGSEHAVDDRINESENGNEIMPANDMAGVKQPTLVVESIEY
jgi:hypothetical protein